MQHDNTLISSNAQRKSSPPTSAPERECHRLQAFLAGTADELHPSSRRREEISDYQYSRTSGRVKAVMSYKQEWNRGIDLILSGMISPPLRRDIWRDGGVFVCFVQ